MKKIYSQPSAKVISVDCTCLMATSGEQSTEPQMNNSVGNGVQLSRESNTWDNWEDDQW